MGRAIASAFLAAGHPTTVWNRTADKANELLARGAVWAGSPLAALDAGELVIVCVIDANAVDAIFDRALAESGRSRLPGTRLVNLTSEGPGRTRELAARADELGVLYLDGSIMTPAAAIGTEATRILYSGPVVLFDRHRHTPAALGGAAVHLGDDPGRAASFHIVHALEEAGVSPAVTQAAKNTVDAAVSAGHEGDSAARLAEFLGRGHTNRDPQAAG
ncbi:hypothetical protein GCM10023178_08280 [Actinomadura luteofluorescens]